MNYSCHGYGRVGQCVLGEMFIGHFLWLNSGFPTGPSVLGRGAGLPFGRGHVDLTWREYWGSSKILMYVWRLIYLITLVRIKHLPQRDYCVGPLFLTSQYFFMSEILKFCKFLCFLQKQIRPEKIRKFASSEGSPLPTKLPHPSYF